MAAVNFFFSVSMTNTSHCLTTPTPSCPLRGLHAKPVTNFGPVSLSHNAGKLISKLLASRLAENLNSLVSRGWSVFIKWRSIHNNSLYTQNIIRELQKAGLPTLLLKLDIAKAFDTVRWDFLLEVLERMGFGCRWRAWVTILLASASSTLFLNGPRGRWFKHRTGLRQGVHSCNGAVATHATKGNRAGASYTNQ